MSHEYVYKISSRYLQKWLRYNIKHVKNRHFSRHFATRLVPRFQKDPRSWVRWVQGLGPWWILDLARHFCRGTLETLDLKILICRKTLETQDLKILICRWTLEAQDLKVAIVARPWKPRASKFGYVAKPWKPRARTELGTSKFWCLETLKSWTLHHSMHNFMLSIVPESLTGDKLGRSDSKTWIVEK